MLEGEELWSFVFRSRDKVWVWSAMNRETREIVASACGERSENTCRILWDRVPSTYTDIIPNYCRLLARYHFKNYHYHRKKIA